VFHAVIVLVVASVPIWVSRHMAHALVNSEAALIKAQAASKEAEGLADRSVPVKPPTARIASVSAAVMLLPARAP
jgi:hypothetical protein